MKHTHFVTYFILIVLLFGTVSCENGEIFQYKTNTFIKNWLLCGPFPNCQNCSNTDFQHGENCQGFYTDYLESIGGEMLAIPKAGMVIDFPGLDFNPTWITYKSETEGKLGEQTVAPGVEAVFGLENTPDGFLTARASFPLSKENTLVSEARHYKGKLKRHKSPILLNKDLLPVSENGKPFFPIGTYGAPSEDYDKLKEAGYNFVVASPENLDKAQKAGLMATVPVHGNITEDSCSPAFIIGSDYSGEVIVVGKERSIEAKNGIFNDSFDPLDVHIYMLSDNSDIN